VGAGTAAKVHHHTPAGDLQAGKRRRGTVCDCKQHQDAHTGTSQVRQGGVCRWGIGGGALVEKGDQMPHVIAGAAAQVRHQVHTGKRSAVGWGRLVTEQVLVDRAEPCFCNT
jgi:hypothetical protein